MIKRQLTDLTFHVDFVGHHAVVESLLDIDRNNASVLKYENDSHRNNNSVAIIGEHMSWPLSLP